MLRGGTVEDRRSPKRSSTPLVQGIKEVSMLLESHIIPSYHLGIYSNLKTMEKQAA